MQNSQKIALNELMLELLDGAISDERLAVLEEAIQSAEGLEQYNQFMQNYSALRRQGAISVSANPESMAMECEYDEELWELLAQAEKTAQTVELPPPPLELVTDVRKRKQEIHVVHSRSTPAVWTAIISLAALFAVVVYFNVSPHRAPQPAATLTDSINADWGPDASKMQKGVRLYDLKRPKTLLSGYSEITFDYGAKVVIEGPAVFEIKSPEQIYLSRGKIVAYVPQQATGFILDTPTARIVDLGTEFGVDVAQGGDVAVHMFEGKASLIPGVRGDAKESHTLAAGYAKRVAAGSGLVQEVAFADDLFARKIDSEKRLVWKGQKTINLADLAEGGNGFGVLQPDLRYSILNKLYLLQAGRMHSDHYYPDTASRYVDGAFIPGGEFRLTSRSRVDDGRWHEVRVERMENKWTLLLDGNVEAVASLPYEVSFEAATEWFIGASVLDRFFFNGQVADIKVHHFDPGADTYVLKAHWAMDEPQPGPVIDASGHYPAGVLKGEVGVGQSGPSGSEDRCYDFAGRRAAVNTRVVGVLPQTGGFRVSIVFKTSDPHDGENNQGHLLSNNRFQVGRGNFHVVDGVVQFFASGGIRGIQVTSQGHRWAECPETQGLGAEAVMQPGSSGGSGLAEQGGTSPSRPTIPMYGNTGITFDLEMIRSDYPTFDIARFRAFLSVGREGLPGPSADFVILVDGRTCFDAKDIAPGAEPQEVMIELTRQDRFLTLISTNSGRGMSGSARSVLVRPILEMN